MYQMPHKTPCLLPVTERCLQAILSVVLERLALKSKVEEKFGNHAQGRILQTTQWFPLPTQMLCQLQLRPHPCPDTPISCLSTTRPIPTCYTPNLTLYPSVKSGQRGAVGRHAESQAIEIDVWSPGPPRPCACHLSGSGSPASPTR